MTFVSIQVLVQVETSEVCIPDFDYDTISWMLRYMYGCLELTPQHLSHARVTQLSVAFTCYTAEPSCWDDVALHLPAGMSSQHLCAEAQLGCVRRTRTVEFG